MTRRPQLLVLTFMLVAAGTAAAGVIVTDRTENEFPLVAGGVVVIDNPVGNVEVIGSDDPKVVVKSDRVIRATDGTAVAEARQQVQRVIEGNERTRFVRTVAPASAASTWNVQVHYVVTIPRTASVKVLSSQSGRIRVADMRGQISVKNVNGPVLIEDVSGSVVVENINGGVLFSVPRGLRANTRLSSINGSIAARVPAGADFIWEVDTVMGEAKTSFPVRSGRFLTPTRFRGAVNTPRNVTLVTETFGGNVVLLAHGVDEVTARSVRTLVQQVAPQRPPAVGPMLPPNRTRADVQLPLVQGFYEYATSIGDIRIDEIRGAARIMTGAGEVHLGTVYGHCNVVSNGGPLTLGEIIGPLTARTEAGNVSVQRAREGGTIRTGGGTIQVQYSGGPIQLWSGGGDIIVRQALGPVSAETRSGDITLAVAAPKSTRLSAKTAKGNVLLTLPAGFGADVDAVIITSDPATNSISSDFPGLSVQREQVGGKTRIRATGKLNGGGERVELQAHDGGIHINIDAPRVSPMLPIQ